MNYSFGTKFPACMKLLEQRNILIAGNADIGKSTVVDAFCQTKIAGDPTETISSEPHKSPQLPITIYDTPGLLMGKTNQSKKEILNFIKKKNNEEQKKQIHIAWYCFNSQVARISEDERRWIDSISKEVPVITIITRASGVEKKELEPRLKNKEDFNFKKVVPIMALQEKTPRHNVYAYGLNSVLSATEDLLSDIAKIAISKAIKAKANKASGWCIDRCGKILLSRPLPIPPQLGLPLTTFFQTRMLDDISRAFDHA